MICHVCERQASGQCKSCRKVLLPRHGDVFCVYCAVVSPALPEQRTSQPEVGPTCYICAQPAVGACSKCGQFYCSGHSSNSGYWIGRAYCVACYESFKRLYAVQVTVGLSILGLVALLVFARGCG